MKYVILDSRTSIRWLTSNQLYFFSDCSPWIRDAILSPDHKTVFDFSLLCLWNVQIQFQFWCSAGCSNWAIWADLRFGFVLLNLNGVNTLSFLILIRTLFSFHKKYFCNLYLVICIFVRACLSFRFGSFQRNHFQKSYKRVHYHIFLIYNGKTPNHFKFYWKIVEDVTSELQFKWIKKNPKPSLVVYPAVFKEGIIQILL